MFLGNVDHLPEEALAYGSMFERSHADGIILIGDIRGGESAADSIASQHRYVVGVTDRTGPRSFPGVHVDNEAGTLAALEHLWGLGHRAIMCVSDARTADGRLRIEVYERFMREHGEASGSTSRSPTRRRPWRSSSGRGSSLDRSTDIETTAIYATSDTTALGLMQAAFRAGIPIPDRLSIVGFDDIDVAAFTIPPLTTVSQHGAEMGREAVELLMELLEVGPAGDGVEDRVIVPTLVVRGSTSEVPPSG